MKKLFLLVLMIALIGLFAGCNNGEEDNVVDVSTNVLEGTILEFTTTTLAGESASEDIFSNNDLTMINIWASWCPGCVEEMPELAKLYAQLPENVNLITLNIDTEADLELAKDIVDSVDSPFMTLTTNDDLDEALVSKIDVVPTSIFVDFQGKIVGELLAGAPGKGEELIKNYLDEINDRLQ